MHITGGRFGGRVLAAPDDRCVRPTAEKVRQAVFNILTHKDFGTGFTLEKACVIDLFAGTGAMGLEALSRGAAFCLFVDHAAAGRALLRRNVEALALTGATKIWRRDASALGPRPPGAGGAFDLAILDPPYRGNLLAPSLEGLSKGGWLKPQALVVAERALDEALPPPALFSQVDTRSYGDTAVEFLVFDPAN